MDNFELTSDFMPTGDQPEAIRQLVAGLQRGDKAQVLLGVTGSGKTFTVANVIAQINRPTLVLSHNKTLAAQLYNEFKTFFPNNAVEYFVSYYDYYQPEAYIPSTNTYIEKDLAINEDIEKLRLRATSALLSGRKDIIVVSSVSCIYGMGNPSDFAANIIYLKKGQKTTMKAVMKNLVAALYSRNDSELGKGTFRVKGDTMDILPVYADFAFRIIFFDNEIDEMYVYDLETAEIIDNKEEITIFPANLFTTTKEKLQEAILQIERDMMVQCAYFEDEGKHLEAKRLEERVRLDLDMMREVGYCSGIENYSRYLDGRKEGTRPFCLIDYFPKDFLLVIDESHVTVSQIHAMYGGDRSRKINLVGYGFRLPSALDNRPLTYDEFCQMTNQVIYISATPADYELKEAGGVVVEQLIRPTGLLDPIIEVCPSQNQVDDLLEEIEEVVKSNNRVLVTTLTKCMAEELTKYLVNLGIKTRYIHSDVDTLERVEILQDLRAGIFDVLVGVNLLREGLDLPEVSLVAILDADKEGFLRSARSLTQTAGRAARNVNSKVIMYADKITPSMKQTIDETARRREIQTAYNIQHNITPTQIKKEIKTDLLKNAKQYYIEPEKMNIAADPIFAMLTKDEIKKSIVDIEKQMQKAAKELDFVEAARLRDEIQALKLML
ncbi:MAG: excinuclease ABC subunit UvrB [Bacteroidales bacterium]|jgi:excinuclease ABC subunit B|nr:excinuclease ABC subunit UvrB [Bacteroidales bacterium]